MGYSQPQLPSEASDGLCRGDRRRGDHSDPHGLRDPSGPRDSASHPGSDHSGGGSSMRRRKAGDPSAPEPRHNVRPVRPNTRPPKHTLRPAVAADAHTA